MSKICFLFDVDGTLTDPREKMDKEFASFFLNWAQNKEVFLISGSDLPKIEEQIPRSILTECGGVFSCMGIELWEFSPEPKNIYKNNLSLDPLVYEFLNGAIVKSGWNIYHPPHFEERSGMLNFSIVGRGADQETRKSYYYWDESSQERKYIAAKFNERFKSFNLEALVGGQTSLDIQEIGKDKGQIIDYLNYDIYIFFGDKCGTGGNDYNLYIKCHEGWHVESYQDTFEILKTNY